MSGEYHGLRSDETDSRNRRCSARLACSLSHGSHFLQTELCDFARVSRPEVFAKQFQRQPAAVADASQQITFDVKYEGYVARQEEQVARQRRLAERLIPPALDYEMISQLRCEARQKLSRIRPLTLAQAGRISGITPADLALLLAHLERRD